MNSSPIDTPSPRAFRVEVTNDTLAVQLLDGRTISVPLSWFPRLQQASGAERTNWELIGNGEGIHWPALDEDVAVESLLEGRRSTESSGSFRRWVVSRRDRRL